MRQYAGKLSGQHKVHFLLTFDADDKTMEKDGLLNELRDILVPHSAYVSCEAVWGSSTNKVNAINRDLDRLSDIPWSTILLASDDMEPVVAGYDDVIMTDMGKHFPDTDGVLWYNDRYAGRALNTLALMGRAYFERFGYIYNPVYSGVFCDNELGDIAEALGKQVYSDRVIIRHQHPANTREVKPDAQYGLNGKYHRLDGDIYRARKNAGFGLGLVTPPTAASLDVGGKVAQRRSRRAIRC